MTLECKVTANNEYFTTVDFDGESVQLPPIHREATIVFVEKTGNKYKVVPGRSKKTKVHVQKEEQSKS